MSAEDVETDRTRVQTYVPTYQKAEWEAHADELDMSLSEFVRSMVQAGRRGFEGEPAGTPSSDDDPQGTDVEDRVLEVLSEDAYYDWSAIRDAVAGDIEAQIEDVLQELQNDGRVRYSGPNGGYVLE